MSCETVAIALLSVFTMPVISHPDDGITFVSGLLGANNTSWSSSSESGFGLFTGLRSVSDSGISVSMDSWARCLLLALLPVFIIRLLVVSIIRTVTFVEIIQCDDTFKIGKIKSSVFREKKPVFSLLLSLHPRLT